MLDSFTPEARSFSLAPATRGSMTVEFQRAWTMATRRPAPSCCCGVGPLRDMISVARECFVLADWKLGGMRFEKSERVTE